MGIFDSLSGITKTLAGHDSSQNDQVVQDPPILQGAIIQGDVSTPSDSMQGSTADPAPQAPAAGQSTDSSTIVNDVQPTPVNQPSVSDQPSETTPMPESTPDTPQEPGESASTPAYAYSNNADSMTQNAEPTSSDTMPVASETSSDGMQSEMTTPEETLSNESQPPTTDSSNYSMPSPIIDDTSNSSTQSAIEPSTQNNEPATPLESDPVSSTQPDDPPLDNDSQDHLTDNVLAAPEPMPELPQTEEQPELPQPPTMHELTPAESTDDTPISPDSTPNDTSAPVEPSPQDTYTPSSTDDQSMQSSQISSELDMVDTISEHLPPNVSLKVAIAITVAILNDYSDQFKKAQDEGKVDEFFDNLFTFRKDLKKMVDNQEPTTSESSESVHDDVASSYTPPIAES